MEIPKVEEMCNMHGKLGCQHCKESTVQPLPPGASLKEITNMIETSFDIEEIRKLVKYPVRYDKWGTYIFDADSHMVLMIRGWGRLQYLPEAEAKQDEIGNFVAQAINDKLRPFNKD